MPLFRSKRVIEAVRYDGDITPDLRSLLFDRRTEMPGVERGTPVIGVTWMAAEQWLEIHLQGGAFLTARIGDWIVRSTPSTVEVFTDEDLTAHFQPLEGLSDAIE